MQRRTEEDSPGSIAQELSRAEQSPGGSGGSQSVDPLSNQEKAFLTLLFNKYRGPLYRYLSGLVRPTEDVAELVQETYFRIMRHAETVRFETVARSYLFRTATNIAREYYRRRSRRHTEQHVGLEEAEGLPAELAPEQDPVWQEATSRLKAELMAMPHELRDVLVRHRFQEQTCRDISIALGVSTRTVERRLSEAMELLARRLRGVL